MSFEDTCSTEERHQVGRHQVTSQRRQIQFKDGSHVWLHGVLKHGAPDQFLRALCREHDKFDIIDMRTLAPSLAEDLVLARPNDVQGIVLFTLRHRYASADAFMAALPIDSAARTST